MTTEMMIASGTSRPGFFASPAKSTAIRKPRKANTTPPEETAVKIPGKPEGRKTAPKMQIRRMEPGEKDDYHKDRSDEFKEGHDGVDLGKYSNAKVIEQKKQEE